MVRYFTIIFFIFDYFSELIQSIDFQQHRPFLSTHSPLELTERKINIECLVFDESSNKRPMG